MREFRRSELLTHGSAFLAAAGFGWYFAMLHGGGQRWARASLEALSEGRGIAPMQYRYLLPGLVGLLRRSGLPALELVSFAEWEALFDQLGVLALWAGTAWLLRLTVRLPRAACSLLALLPLPALLVHYVTLRANYVYVYDLPSVAFFTWGLAASIARRRGLLLALFALGTLNRETMLFVAVADLAVWGTHRGERRRALVRHVALVAVWVAIKAGLAHAFRDNVDPAYSGVLWKAVLERNLHDVQADPLVRRYWTSVFGYLWVPVVLLFGQIRKTAIGRVMLVLVPFGALMAVVGLLEEVRIFGEFLPAVFCAFVALVQHAARGDLGGASAADAGPRLPGG